MTKRIDRSVPLDVRKKISEGMKRYYHSQSHESREKRALAQSRRMIEYWSRIPSKATD